MCNLLNYYIMIENANVRIKSSTITRIVDVTTEFVVAEPTPSAPPVQLNP